MFELRRLYSACLSLGALFFATLVFARDGSNDVFIAVPSGATTGWKTFEIFSGQDSLSGSIAKEGFAWGGEHYKWDGLGAYLYSNDVLRVFVNHEVEDSTFSRIDLDVTNLKNWIVAGTANNTNTNQVLPVAPIVEAVSRGWLSGATSLDGPCSGNVWMKNTFGESRGFEESLYLLGEETFDATGNIWVMDIETRIIYAVTSIGGGSWENATIIDTGRTDTVALVLSEDLGAEDFGSAPLRLYVGEKNPLGNFLERNGLSGGMLYYWDPVSESSTDGTMTGIFSGGNGATVTGEWTASSVGAALFSKSEDVHTNMNKDSDGYGVEVALAAQEEAVFKIDFSTVSFVQGDLAQNQQSEVLVLFETEAVPEQTALLCGMDNIVWSADGKIYINEDDDEGNIWVIDPAALEAGYALNDFTPDATQYAELLDSTGQYDGSGGLIVESSGIIDISELLDYQAGSVFLTCGQSWQTSANQIAMLVAPTASLLVDAYDDWALSFPGLDTLAKRLEDADPDFDGLNNALEFALDLSPVVADYSSVLSLDFESSEVEFTPKQSLNLVSYWVDYTEDLSTGFTQSIAVTSLHIDASGKATVAVPNASDLFVRLRADVP